MLVIGLSALGLTQSPRPSSISPEVYSRMRGVEWTLGILFIIVGMIIVRMVILKFTKLHEESPSTKETFISIVPTVIVGALLSVWIVNYLRTPLVIAANTPMDDEISEIGPTTNEIIGTWNVTAGFDRRHYLTEFKVNGTYSGNGKQGQWRFQSKNQVWLERFDGNKDYVLRIINSRRMVGGMDGFTFTR